MNLQQLEHLIQVSLQERLQEIDPTLILQPQTPLAHTPDKGYYAKAIHALHWKEQPLGTGKLVTIVFRPGEGTGNHLDYQLTNIPPAWTPRNKTGTAELFISIGTYHEGLWHTGVTSLSAVTLTKDQTTIERYKCLTHSTLERSLTPDELGMHCHRHFDLTLNKERNYGNPHAIIWKTDINNPESLQVASFLQFLEPSEGLTLVQQKLQTVYIHET